MSFEGIGSYLVSTVHDYHMFRKGLDNSLPQAFFAVPGIVHLTAGVVT
jgi:hypothetical protein